MGAATEGGLPLVFVQSSIIYWTNHEMQEAAPLPSCGQQGWRAQRQGILRGLLNPDCIGEDYLRGWQLPV